MFPDENKDEDRNEPVENTGDGELHGADDAPSDDEVSEESSESNDSTAGSGDQTDHSDVEASGNELDVSDVPEGTEEAPEDTGEVAKYKVLSAIDIVDGSQQKQGEYREGQIIEVPVVIGDIYVKEGRAERVVE